MRVVVVLVLVLLSGCASEKLALTPPPGVDFSGQWKLNTAESDDPLRLVQSQIADPSKATAGSGPQGGQGRGRGGGRQGGQGGGGGYAVPGGPAGPTVPVIGALSEGLRWPGQDVQITQAAGVVTVTSAGVSRVLRPTSGSKPHQRRKPRDDGEDPRDRDMPARDRGGPPAVCGWEGGTLLVQSGETDDDHPPFEERFSVSEDGQRLVELVGFTGGRAGGFTMSRVWDRVVPAPLPAPAVPGVPQTEKSRAVPGS
jgi:hypothetical protein